MMEKNFKVVELSSDKATIQIQGMPLNHVNCEDFIVFRTKEFLSDKSVTSLLEVLERLHSKKKIILLPSFIQVCKFVGMSLDDYENVQLEITNNDKGQEGIEGQDSSSSESAPEKDGSGNG